MPKVFILAAPAKGVLRTLNEKTYYVICIPAQHPVSLCATEFFAEVYPEDVF